MSKKRNALKTSWTGHMATDMHLENAHNAGKCKHCFVFAEVQGKKGEREGGMERKIIT